MKIAQVWIEHPSSTIDQVFDYLATADVFRGTRVLVEFNRRQVIGFVEEVLETVETEEEYFLKNGYYLKPVLQLIDEKPLLNEELFSLAKEIAYRTVSPQISVFQAMLPSKLKPRSNKQQIKQTAWVKLIQFDDSLKGKRKDAMNYLKDHPLLQRVEFNKMYSGILKELEKRELVEVFYQDTEYQVQTKVTKDHLPLTAQQETAYQKILASDKSVILLHGATGSGKTEVYLHLTEEVLQEGKQVLILVPEISLTPQMVKRVEERFGNQVAIYHSRLNDQEKYEQYQRVLKQEVSVVVGTRSAVFMPFHNLGFIILDEEHDGSYKQDSLPRYHCRDVAIWRGNYHSCKVLLGSATPSLESYARATKEVYELVVMKDRIYQQALPKCQVINTRIALERGEDAILTKQLLQEIQKRLDKKQQVILLLNRRGHTPIVKCRECNEVVMCKECDVAMNYHKDEHRLVCHTCGLTTPLPKVCSHCGSTHFTWWGYGTQKVEEECHKYFPDARIYRMDTDTVSKKGGHEAILSAFEHRGDILVGTQMIAKGLDYPRVTLVGILSADALLARSDYRSVEVTFDLIVQASGRSGRGQEIGEVLIQAFDPTHYAIQTACHHDYLKFFQLEMQYRHLGGYPPYTFLTSFVFSHKEVGKSFEEAQEFAQSLTTYSNLRILGPSELLKKKMQYRTRVLVKSKNFEEMISVIQKEYQLWLKKKSSVKVAIDVNPLLLD